MNRAAVILMTLVLALGWSKGTAHAQGNNNSNSWQFETTPYLWGSALVGTVGVRGRTADVDVSFSEILEHLDGAFMLPFEGRKNRFGFGMELISVKVSDDHATPGPLFSGAELTAKTSIREIGPRFRIKKGDRVNVDLLAGARWWKLNNTLTLEQDTLPSLRFNLDESWVDLIGGARMFVNLNNKWLFQARADAGALGSSFTWQGLGGVAYTFGPRFTLRTGYRYLDVDFEDDEDDFVYDVALRGLIIGASWKF